MTWKENTPFAPHAGYPLDGRIDADDNDNRRNAIQYILLHELRHVLLARTYEAFPLQCPICHASSTEPL